MKNTVERIELAPDLNISRVLTGLWQIADMERDGKPLDPVATAKHMHAYANAGFTTFDMADHYGSAEIISGEFLRQTGEPNRVQLFTKWVPKPGAISESDVREAVERALDRMKTDRIDLLQFHAWNYPDPAWLDGLFHLQALKKQGLIRHLGLTNFDTAHLQIVVNSGIEIVSNQVCFSLIDQRPAAKMTELCLRHNIKLLAYGTVAGGFLTEKWIGKTEPTAPNAGTWSRMKYKRFIDAAGGWQPFQQLLETLSGIAKKHGVSIANVASRCILEQPAVGGVIIGARLGASEHVSENLRLFDFSLDAADKSAIAAAQSQLSPIPGDSGDEYRKPPYLTASGDLSHHIESMPQPYPTKIGSDGRTRVLSGTVWEKFAGYSRAVRHGNHITVSGTTATHGDRVIGGSDPAAQAHFAIDKIEGAIQSLGGSLADVVRTRIFVKNIDQWEAVARAHGERFGEIQPANTLVQAALVGDQYLVEIEADAIIPESR